MISVGYGMDDWSSIPGWGRDFLLFTTASRPALWPTQPPIQSVRWVVAPGVKRPRRKADYSFPPNAEFKNAWSYTSIPHTRCWCGTGLSRMINLPLTFTVTDRLRRLSWAGNTARSEGTCT